MFERLSLPLSRVLEENSQNVDFDDWGPRATEPVGDGVYVDGLGGATSKLALLLVPFGVGAPGSKFRIRVHSWRHVGGSTAANVLWIPLLLAELEVTLGTQRGLSNKVVNEAESFADTIRLVAGDLSFYGSITEGPIAHASIDLRGGQKFSFDFAQGEMPGVFGNCLMAETSPSA